MQGGFQYKLNSDACTIIPYPAIEEKHIRQVYVISELKKKLFCFCTRQKYRCVNLSAVLKFATTQNEPKRAEMK